MGFTSWESSLPQCQETKSLDIVLLWLIHMVMFKIIMRILYKNVIIIDPQSTNGVGLRSGESRFREFSHCSVMTLIQFVMTCLETFQVERFTTTADKQGTKKAFHFRTVSHSYPIVHIWMDYFYKFNRDLLSLPQSDLTLNMMCDLHTIPACQSVPSMLWRNKSRKKKSCIPYIARNLAAFKCLETLLVRRSSCYRGGEMPITEMLNAFVLLPHQPWWLQLKTCMTYPGFAYSFQETAVTKNKHLLTFNSEVRKHPSCADQQCKNILQDTQSIMKMILTACHMI